MRMCDRCPRRDMAYLLRALGDETAAARIEAEGCPWWWPVTMKDGDSGAVREEEGCGVRYLPRFLNEFGSRTAEASQSVQSARNDTVEMLEQIRDRSSAVLRDALADELPKHLAPAVKGAMRELVMEQMSAALVEAGAPVGELGDGNG